MAGTVYAVRSVGISDLRSLASFNSYAFPNEPNIAKHTMVRGGEKLQQFLYCSGVLCNALLNH